MVASKIKGIKSINLTAIEIILKHSFPNGKDDDYNPKFRMSSPKKDYVLNKELTKILKVLDADKK